MLFGELSAEATVWAAAFTFVLAVVTVLVDRIRDVVRMMFAYRVAKLKHEKESLKRENAELRAEVETLKTTRG